MVQSSSLLPCADNNMPAAALTTKASLSARYSATTPGKNCCSPSHLRQNAVQRHSHLASVHQELRVPNKSSPTCLLASDRVLAKGLTRLRIASLPTVACQVSMPSLIRWWPTDSVASLDASSHWTPLLICHVCSFPFDRLHSLKALPVPRPSPLHPNLEMNLHCQI